MAGIRGLLRRLTGKKNPPAVDLVPQRFLQVFREHGVEAAQIPRLFPQLRLEDFQSEQSLLAALTHELLEQAAKFLGIRLEWLEGVDDEIYEFHGCYKQPEILFEDLAGLPSESLSFPVRILISDKHLDNTKTYPQEMVLVVVEQITRLGDERIERYRIYDDIWDWSHPPCRMQLKAMARLLYKKFSTPSPIFVVSADDLEKIGERKRIPRPYLHTGLCTSPSLEDFALTKEESVVAREVDEIPLVLEYIRQHKLEETIAGLELHPFSSEDVSVDQQRDPIRGEKAIREEISRLGRKNALSRYAELNRPGFRGGRLV